MSGWDQTYQALQCWLSSGDIPACTPQGAPPGEAKGPSTLWDVSLQVLRDNIPLGTTKAEWPRCQRHLSSPGCPWNSVRSPGLASTLMDHLPVTGHHVPPLETLEICA